MINNSFNEKKENINKYRINIKKNNHNYSIILYIIKEKLQISIKYSNADSEEIFEFCNFYSYYLTHLIFHLIFFLLR